MFTSDEQNLTFTSQKNNKHETIPSRFFPEQKTKRSFVLRHLRPVHEVLTKNFTTKLRLWTKFLACTVCALLQYMSVLFTSTSLGIHLCKQNLTNLQFSKRRRGAGICLSDALKLHRVKHKWLARKWKGPWEGEKPLSISRLPLRANFHQERDFSVRGRIRGIPNPWWSLSLTLLLRSHPLCRKFSPRSP